MNKKDKLIAGIVILIITGCVITLVFIGNYLSGVTDRNKKEFAITIKVEIQKSTEAAYFLGQKDALEGKVCIFKDSLDNWHWSKSPYSDSTMKLMWYPEVK